MKVNSKICLPVIGENLEEFLINLEKTQKIHNFIELRADYIHNFGIEDLLKIKELTKVSSVFVCRNKKDGGNFVGKEENWQLILQEALKLGFDFIDIEFSQIKKIDFSNKNPQTKIILSLHDFNQTPGYRNLRKIQKRMRGFNPNIIKFATFIKTEKDIQNLFRLILSSKKQDKIIAIGMGEKGKITRILGTFMGSPFTFAALTDQITAPGQLSMSQIEEAQKYLKF
jgi:3-dehydroquinate dehydratase I